MSDSSILSNLQVGIRNWGFEWDHASKQQKRRYNALDEPFLRAIIFVERREYLMFHVWNFGINLWTVSCKIISTISLNIIMSYTKSELEITIGFTHITPIRTSGTRNALRHHIPELLNKFPKHLIGRIKTHSIYSLTRHIKYHSMALYSYKCSETNCSWVLWLPYDHWL